jgi:hypothetical protein
MRTLALAALAALVLTLSACGQSAETSVAPAPAAEVPAPAPPADAAFCEEVARRVSPADCAVLERLADQAETGVAAFNAPNPMARGEAHTLQLAISFAPPDPAAVAPPLEPAPSVDDAREPGEIIASLPGTTVQFTPLVGRFMRAELVGDGFDIAAVTPASQEVLPESSTVWSWRVAALAGGQRTLTLTTVVEGCTAEGQCYPLRSTSTNYQVEVSVGWLGRAEDFLRALPNWLQLATAVLVALAALVGAIFGLRSAFRRGRSA